MEGNPPTSDNSSPYKQALSHVSNSHVICRVVLFVQTRSVKVLIFLWSDVLINHGEKYSP